MVESRRRDPSKGVRPYWPQEILKTGTLEMRFPTLQDFAILYGLGTP